MYERQSTGQTAISTQTGLAFFRAMEKNNWAHHTEALRAPLLQCGNSTHIRLFDLYVGFFRKAHLSLVHEDPGEFSRSAFFSPLYSHLLMCLHTCPFGFAPPTLRNLATNMPLQLRDFAIFDFTARGSGAEGGESGVRIRRQLQGHMTGLLSIGGNNETVEREAIMYEKKMKVVLWKSTRLPSLVPGHLGAKARQLRANKRVAKQQGPIERSILPPPNFQRKLVVTAAGAELLQKIGGTENEIDKNVKEVVQRLGDVERSVGNLHVPDKPGDDPIISVSVGAETTDSSTLKVSLYTSPTGGWDRFDLKDTTNGAGVKIRKPEVHKHAVENHGNGTFTLHVQLKRAPKQLKAGAVITSLSASESLQFDRYRNIRIKGRGNLKAGWETWCEVWSLVPQVAARSVRSTFQQRELYDSQAGSEVLKSLLHSEATKKADRCANVPFIEQSNQERTALAERLELLEAEWLSGKGSPLLYCMFCKAPLVLLDERPVPRWCNANTGVAHSFCSERRTWAGDAGGVLADEDPEEQEGAQVEETN